MHDRRRTYLAGGHGSSVTRSGGSCRCRPTDEPRSGPNTDVRAALGDETSEIGGAAGDLGEEVLARQERRRRRLVLLKVRHGRRRPAVRRRRWSRLVWERDLAGEVSRQVDLLLDAHAHVGRADHRHHPPPGELDDTPPPAPVQGVACRPRWREREMPRHRYGGGGVLGIEHHAVVRHDHLNRRCMT